MGTRGFVGFVADKTEKIAYNHSDSYPGGLGLDVLRWLRFAVADLDELRRRIASLRLIDGMTLPTPEEIEHLRPWTNLGVGAQSTSDWYCLLRETQGNPGAMLQAGFIHDAADFPLNSLFAEYGYLVDLDDEQFEVYVGFQREPHSAGRFAGREGKDGYAPVALVEHWPLADLPTDEAFLAALEGDDE